MDAILAMLHLHGDGTGGRPDKVGAAESAAKERTTRLVGDLTDKRLARSKYVALRLASTIGADGLRYDTHDVRGEGKDTKSCGGGLIYMVSIMT